MEEKIFYVKKLDNPNFSDLSCLGKNLIAYYKHPLTDLPVEFHLGEVKPDCRNGVYLKGFTMVDSNLHQSELEKQIILEREYHGKFSNFESPLTGLDLNKNIFYEFEGNVIIDELKNIADGKNQKFIIKSKGV